MSPQLVLFTRTDIISKASREQTYSKHTEYRTQTHVTQQTDHLSPYGIQPSRTQQCAKLLFCYLSKSQLR